MKSILVYRIFNPYSGLTPPGGFLHFHKITTLLDILVVNVCKIIKYVVIY